jgi:exportin-1
MNRSQLLCLSLGNSRIHALLSTNEPTGAVVTGHTIIRNMRAVKKEVLKLLDIFIEQSEPADVPNLCQNFLPAMLDPLLGDYARNVAGARDAEVLGLFATIVDKLGVRNAIDPPTVCVCVCMCVCTCVFFIACMG